VWTLIGTGRKDHRFRMSVASRGAKHEPITR
jgi:hypothetical protein